MRKPADSTKSKRAPDDPCAHMESLINRLHDRSLGGFAKAYTLFHIFYCGYCRRFLKSLDGLRAKLSESKESQVPADALERLKTGAWRDQDKQP